MSKTEQKRIISVVRRIRLSIFFQQTVEMLGKRQGHRRSVAKLILS
jgi:hypothetical protein